MVSCFNNFDMIIFWGMWSNLEWPQKYRLAEQNLVVISAPGTSISYMYVGLQKLTAN